ncbi:MAG: YfiR family protein [Sedimentisphaerales bacterium]|nr:YfiR family protein [Sedimentisphaerales bacterium]
MLSAGELPIGRAQENNTATPEQRQAMEYEIKAVYLYNFLQFAAWPEAEKDTGTKPDAAQNPAPDSEKKEKDTDALKKNTICIGILGQDLFGESFNEVEEKVIPSLKKKLVIKRFGPYDSKVDITRCHLLFISSSEEKNLKPILAQVKDAPILTVADTAGFIETGGMINLIMKKNKVRWEINLTPVRRAGLRLDSQLIRNAVRVVEIPELSDKETSQGPAHHYSKDNRVTVVSVRGGP